MPEETQITCANCGEPIFPRNRTAAEAFTQHPDLIYFCDPCRREQFIFNLGREVGRREAETAVLPY